MKKSTYLDPFNADISLPYTNTYEGMKTDLELVYGEFKPNPNKCKKGHNYVNNVCVNCDRELVKTIHKTHQNKH